MARFRSAKIGATLAAGFAALWLAHRIEYQGDFAYVTRNPGVAAGFHLTALGVDLAGLGCFIAVFVMIVRGFRDTDEQPPSDQGAVPLSRAAAKPVARETGEPFDADAIMARYMAQREPGAPPPAAAQTMPHSAPRGFGRKQV